MPGYTHTQRAMPTTVGTWLGSFGAALADDLELLQAARKIIDQNPLGSVAGFGEDVFGLDREYTTKEMGFSKTQENPIYCAMSRGKFENIILQALSQVMFDLGKLANDLVWFTSKEFNFFDLPEEFKTGSSVMPQKKNFDLLELVRGNSSIFFGYQFQVQEVVKNLLSGYNRDMQLTKEPYLKAIKLAIATLEIMDLTVSNLKINEENLKLACTDEMLATKKAYQMVKEGKSFRDAYREVGKQINSDKSPKNK
jgi:argininosuccinate lyase